MSEKKDYVPVEIPSAMAEGIQKQPWFKYYDDLSEFVKEAVREHLIRKKAEAK